MPAELATSLTSTEAERLEQAEALVRGFCGWHIAPSREATYTVRTFGGTRVFLPSLHVTEIASVTEADVALVLTEEYLWLTPDSVITRPTGAWGVDTEVVVEFTHGYAEVPKDVEAIVKAVAQRAVDNPGSVIRRQVGPFSDTYSTTGANQATPLALLESEKEALRPYRLPAVF